MSKGTISPDGKWLWTGAEWIPAPPTSPPVMPPPPPSTPAAPAEPESSYFSSNSNVENDIAGFHQIIQQVGEESHMEATDGRTGQPVDGKYATWTVESVSQESGLYWVIANKKQTMVHHHDVEKVRFIFSSPSKDSLIEGHTWKNGNWSPHFTTGARDRMIFDPFGQNKPKPVALNVPLSGGFVDSNFERDIRRNIQMIGRECFPDDENATWNILSIREENGLHWVETKPIPHVGYEKIMFAMTSPNAGGVKECHYWENGSWSVLFS